MIINRSNLQAVFVNLLTTFNKAFDGAPTFWEKVATRVPSTGTQNDYTWLSRFPRMREWIGDKVLKSLAAFKYTIVNKRFEATVVVNRDDIEDDNLGIYAPMAMDAGFSAKQLPDELVSDLMNNGFTEKGFDGQYFYDTDHDVGGASVSNKLTAALSAANLAGANASIGAARTAMMSFKDEEGRPLGIIPNILVVPPALESTALILANSEKLNDNGPNPFKGTFTVEVNPRLTSTTAWHLLCTTRPIKPFLFQDRKPAKFVQQTSMDSDDVFNRGEFKFGAEARGNAGYGLWQLAVGSTGAG